MQHNQWAMQIHLCLVHRSSNKLLQEKKVFVMETKRNENMKVQQFKYVHRVSHVVTAPWECSIPNLPARPAICLACAERSTDTSSPSNFSRVWNTIRLIFLSKTTQVITSNLLRLVTYKLRPIPTASVATMMLQAESGSLNSCACWTRVAGRAMTVYLSNTAYMILQCTWGEAPINHCTFLPSRSLYSFTCFKDLLS